MLALTLATMTLVQAPQAPQTPETPRAMKLWVDQEGDPTRPDSYVVSGLPELSRKAAWESAMMRAREERQERLAAVGWRYLEQHVPVWLPAFVSERVLDEWCAEQGHRQGLEELDRDMIVRDHAFTRSYQGFLLLEEPGSISAVPRSLERRLGRAKEGFVRRCGAVCALWGMLALAAFWLDRLTRGYMTMRLALLALAAGVAGPFIIMLL
ncbi:MAG: hypothetical protein ACYTGW_11345 [Planctomycetota bacterium]|jgi:hypothetical protein